MATSIKGGIKPGQTIRFGDSLILTTNPVRYLGVLIDYKRNFWSHVQYVAEKIEETYSRLRAATSAEWGTRYHTSMLIYKAVFMPTIAYAAQIWADGTHTAKAIKILGSRQRRALLSVTYAYRTTSTDALCVIAGLLPLDIAIRLEAAKLDHRQDYINLTDYQQIKQISMDEWQNRWETSTKGRWTYNWFPSVSERIQYPMELDHYTTQFLGEHGDFSGKLHHMKLRGLRGADADTNRRQLSTSC